MSWQTNARQRAAPAMAALTAHPVFPKDVQFAPVVAKTYTHPTVGCLSFVARNRHLWRSVPTAPDNERDRGAGRHAMWRMDTAGRQ